MDTTLGTPRVVGKAPPSPVCWSLLDVMLSPSWQIPVGGGLLRKMTPQISVPMGVTINLFILGGPTVGQ